MKAATAPEGAVESVEFEVRTDEMLVLPSIGPRLGTVGFTNWVTFS